MLATILGAVKNGVVTLDQATALLIAGSVVPLLTDLITKCKASSQVKGAVVVVLSVISGVVLALQKGGSAGVKWQDLVAAGLGTLIVSQGAHRTFKATGVSNAVASIAPNTGVGTALSDAAKNAEKKAE